MSSQTIDKHVVSLLNEKVKKLEVTNDYLTGENKKKTAQITALNGELAALKQVCDRLHFEKGVIVHQCDSIYARITHADHAAGIERFATMGLEKTNRKLMADNIILQATVDDMTRMLRESERGTAPAPVPTRPPPVFVHMTPPVITPTPVVIAIVPTPPVPAPVAVIVEVKPVDSVEQAKPDAAAARKEKFRLDAAEAKRVKAKMADKVKRDSDFAAEKEIREAKTLADEQERLKPVLAAKALADEQERLKLANEKELQEKAELVPVYELVIPEKGTPEYKAYIIAQVSCKRGTMISNKRIAELDSMVVVEPSMKNANLFRDTLRDVFLNTIDDEGQDNLDDTPLKLSTTVERVLLSAQELFSIDIWNILPVKDSPLYELHCVMPELRSYEVVKSPPARLEFIAECLDSSELLGAVTKLRSFIPLSCKRNHAIKYERVVDFCSTYLTWLTSSEDGRQLFSILKLTKIDELDTFLSPKYSLVRHLDTGEEQVMKISITRLVEWHRRGKLNIIADHSLKVSASATATKLPGIE